MGRPRPRAGCFRAWTPPWQAQAAGTHRLVRKKVATDLTRQGFQREARRWDVPDPSTRLIFSRVPKPAFSEASRLAAPTREAREARGAHPTRLEQPVNGAADREPARGQAAQPPGAGHERRGGGLTCSRPHAGALPALQPPRGPRARPLIPRPSPSARGLARPSAARGGAGRGRSGGGEGPGRRRALWRSKRGASLAPHCAPAGEPVRPLPPA